MTTKTKASLNVRCHIALISLALSASANAYIDERSSAPAAPLVVNEPSSFSERGKGSAKQPNAVATAAKSQQAAAPNVSGDFSSPKWNDRPQTSSEPIALSEALVMLHFPVANQVVELNINPTLLMKKVTLLSGADRKTILVDLAQQIGSSIHYENAIVTVGEGAQAHASANYPILSEKSTALNPVGGIRETVIQTSEVDINTNYASGMKKEEQIEIATVEVNTPNTPQAVDVRDSTAIEFMTVAEPKIEALILRSDQMLSSEVERYAAKHGMKIIWDADVDYRIAIGFEIDKGGVIENIQQVLSLYKGGPRPLISKHYAAQNLLVIQNTLY